MSLTQIAIKHNDDIGIRDKIRQLFISEFKFECDIFCSLYFLNHHNKDISFYPIESHPGRFNPTCGLEMLAAALRSTLNSVSLGLWDAGTGNVSQQH